MQNQNKEFKQGLFLGMLVGAGTTYFVFKNRKQIAAKFWKLKARADLQRRLANLKRITKKEYEELVDSIVSKYHDVAEISRDDLDEFTEELKGRWTAVKERFDEEVASVQE